MRPFAPLHILPPPPSPPVFGFDKATGEHCAIKVLSKDQRQSSRTIAECEVAIRMSIDHRAIVKTVDVFETPFGESPARTRPNRPSRFLRRAASPGYCCTPPRARRPRPRPSWAPAARRCGPEE